MTILLVACVLAAAGWFLLSVVNRDSGDDPGNSVSDYSRAMAALDPGGPGPRRGVANAHRSRTRPPRPRRARATSQRHRAPARAAPRRAARR